jgi:hypothetical protein
MGKLIIKLSLFIGILALLFFSGCTHSARVSAFSKYNKINKNFFQSFSNDSLKIAIDFSGRHKYQDIAALKKMDIPKDVYKLLKHVTKSKVCQLIFYSTSTLKKLGCNYYGFIIKKQKTVVNKAEFTEHSDMEHHKFLISDLYKYKKSINVVAVVPLVKFYIIFINHLPLNIKNETADEWETDSTIFVRNTIAEISSVVSDSSFIKKSTAQVKLFEKIDKILYQKDSYLKPIKDLLEINIDSVYQLKSFYYQSLLTKVSFLDNLTTLRESYENYLIYLREKSKETETKLIKKHKVFIGDNALTHVPKIAKLNKVIMINESHYDFRHRYFLYLALDSLYKYGYRHLCIEDYVNNDVLKKAYPNRSNGFYIMEPFMAQLIRKATSLGFQLHSYEDTSSSLKNFNNEIEKREYKQAENLYNLYKADSTSKWVVYAGYDHINKKSFMSVYKSCAQYFYDFSGINPYSINQSSFSDLSYKEKHLAEKLKGYYIIDTSSTIYEEKQADLYVVNNIDENPWLQPFISAENYSSYSFKPNNNFLDKQHIFVYLQSEYAEIGRMAIPVYIGELYKNQVLKLHLPSDTYFAITTDSNEEVISTCTINGMQL